MQGSRHEVSEGLARQTCIQRSLDWSCVGCAKGHTAYDPTASTTVASEPKEVTALTAIIQITRAIVLLWRPCRNCACLQHNSTSTAIAEVLNRILELVLTFPWGLEFLGATGPPRRAQGPLMAPGVSGICHLRFSGSLEDSGVIGHYFGGYIIVESPKDPNNLKWHMPDTERVLVEKTQPAARYQRKLIPQGARNSQELLGGAKSGQEGPGGARTG